MNPSAPTAAPDSADVAAVIVTYNGAKWLAQCLESLKACTPRPRIIVVDNASSDGTVAICRADPAVTLIETGDNLGFGRANNIGMAHALQLGCGFVFILNQDAHVAPDALERLIGQARLMPDHGIFCPMQLDDTGAAIDTTFLQYYLCPHAPRMVNDAFLGELAPSYTVQAAPAAAWLLTREFLMKVGGFDPLFFMYCEDDDLCSRARFHGMKIAVVPGARFFHYRGFHGLVRTESALRKLRRKTSRLRSSLVRDIKQPEGGALKNTWHAVTAHLMDGLKAGLGHLDWITALATLAAVARVLVEWPALARHRAVCRGTGPHWLPGQDTRA